MDPNTNLHAMVVHFPIALLFVSVLLDLLALHPRLRDALRPASLITLALGAIGAAVGVATGPDGNARGVTALVHTHEQWAEITMLIFLALTAWRLLLLWRKRPFTLDHVLPYLLVALVGLGTLTYTGYLGGKMVYEEAIGVQRDGKLIVQPHAFGRRPPASGNAPGNP